MPSCLLAYSFLTTTLSSVFVWGEKTQAWLKNRHRQHFPLPFPALCLPLTHPHHLFGVRTRCTRRPAVMLSACQWAGTKPPCGDSPELSAVFVWILTLSLKIVMVGRVSVQLTLAWRQKRAEEFSPLMPQKQWLIAVLHNAAGTEDTNSKHNTAVNAEKG